MQSHDQNAPHNMVPLTQLTTICQIIIQLWFLPSCIGLVLDVAEEENIQQLKALQEVLLCCLYVLVVYHGGVFSKHRCNPVDMAKVLGIEQDLIIVHILIGKLLLPDNQPTASIEDPTEEGLHIIASAFLDIVWEVTAGGDQLMFLYSSRTAVDTIDTTKLRNYGLIGVDP